MGTTFKILSHASMIVNSGKTSVLTDPWLVGSCYWRSWWNFPKASFDEDELKDVKYVILSHIHWDHWHGPTLKKYLKDKIFIIPDEPNDRSYKDLQAIGIKNIYRVKHGVTTDLGDGVKLTLYLFGLHLNDSAIVLETPDVKLLNANDAKIAGMPLRNIISKHGRFDFAFRSHSSANPRVCFEQGDNAIQNTDDELHYARSFKYFMDAVNPVFAIPFASNHCHLHQDTYKFNKNITNPIKLRRQLDQEGGLRNSELKVMLPGSVWSSSQGFSLASEAIFDNLTDAICQYKAEVKPLLDTYYEKEEKVQINEKLFLRYFSLMSKAPFLYRYKLMNFEALYEFTYPTGRVERFLIQPFKKIFRPAIESDMVSPEIIIRFPAIIFKDAVLLNMFHHAQISKRCYFYAQNAVAMNQLQRFIAVKEKIELGAYPVSVRYLSRWLTGYIRRWREIDVYRLAAWQIMVKRKPGYLVEEKILKNT